MSCPFYNFKNNDYYCMKKSDYVNSDCYYRYCRAYSYDECPIYKGDSSGGGCYITSACVCSLGCPDNCYELNLLRDYRDNFLKKQQTGESDVLEYYRIAPKIVEKIDLLDNSKLIYKEIFNQYIKPCVQMIERGELNKCYSAYKFMVYELKSKYLKR